MVTPEVGMSYLDALGFSSITYTDQNIMTTAIGGFTDGVTVADMARGYATIANGGMKSDDTCITKIVDYTGQTIYESGKQEKRVFLEDTAFILSDLLQGTFNEEYGTAHDAKTDDQVYAGKTGTTNDNKDAWFCGYSAYYTTCVWVGCDMPESVSGMYGSSYPLSIWSDFMEQMHEGKQKQDFECPATVVLASTSINNANPYKVDMETMEVAYDKDYYGNRPDGWDYAAGELIDQAIAAAEQRKQETLIAKLEKKVAKFEETVITDAKSATLVQETYTSLVESIRNVTDDETRNTLLERISYKYDLLQEEILSEWGDITKLEEEYAYLQGQEDSILSEQKSAEAADAAYEKSLTSIVEWYIMTLNERTVYTDTIDKLIDDGEDYLDMCSEFDSYADLKAKFLLAKEYAEALPEPEHADDGIPEMPDEEDYEDDVGPEEGTLP
jgi:penicillin-binding protein 1A